jgi:glycosyltransferase involved in cell wall biosynthesis
MPPPSPASPEIVVVTHFFPSHGGGIELVAARLVDEYIRAGHTVEWFASATDVPPAASAGLSVQPVKASNLIEKATQLPYPLWSPCAVPRLWRSIGRARAVHVHEHLYVGSIVAIMIGRLRGKPVVLTQHMGALNLQGRAGTILYTLAAKALALPVMAIASCVAFVSANVSEFFGGSRSSRGRRRLVFNGLDTSTFHPGDREQRRLDRESLGLAQDARVAIFAGRFVRKKGLQFIREIAMQMQDVTWLFAGSGPDDPASWSMSNVRSLGRLTQANLSRAYRAADVLVLPSRGEGFPLVVQEALACGTAVLSTAEVATACPEAADCIHAEELQGDPATVARWHAALRRILETESHYQARRERSTRAAKLWSWQSCAATYLGLLGLEAPSPPLR